MEATVETPGKYQLNGSMVNAKLFAYCLVSLIVAYLLFPHIKPKDNNFISNLSYLILGLGIAALTVFFRSWKRLGAEIDYAQDLRRQAEELVTSIRAGQRVYDIDELGTLGAATPHLVMYRMLDHIYTEVKGRKFESSLITMQPYKEEIAEGVQRISGYQKTALQLGILGTFLGLSAVFLSLGTHTNDLKPMITSLQLGFGTSIAGLQVSIMLWLFTGLLQEKQAAFFVVMEKATDEVLNLARLAVNKDTLLVELELVGAEIRQFTNQMDTQTHILQNQTGFIQEGLSRLRQTRSDFDIFLDGIGASQKEFMTSVQGLYQSLSPENISRSLNEKLTQSVDSITMKLGGFVEGTLAQFNGLNQAVSAIHENMKLVQEQLDKQVKDWNTGQRQLLDELSSLTKNNLHAQQQFTEQLTDKNMMEALNRAVNHAGEQIGRDIRQQMAEIAPHITRFEQNIDQLAQVLQAEHLAKSPFRLLMNMLYACWRLITGTAKYLFSGIAWCIKLFRK